MTDRPTLSLLLSLQTVKALRRKVGRMLLLFSQGRVEHFDVEKINTWVRNHKHKKRGGGERVSGGS